MVTEVTRFGFKYGAATVERWFDDAGRRGWVVFGIVTPKHPRGIQVYVTATGKVRINGTELTPKHKGRKAK